MKNHEAESNWKKCSELTKSSLWRPCVHDSETLTDSRTVTWAHHPFRYNLTEYARREQRIFRTKYTTRMFELAMLSAVRTDINARQFLRYFIFEEPQNTMLLSMNVGELGDPDTSREVRSTFDFVMKNKLLAPNAEDLLVLEHALTLAYNDGVCEYTSPTT